MYIQIISNIVIFCYKVNKVNFRKVMNCFGVGMVTSCCPWGEQLQDLWIKYSLVTYKVL